MTSGLILDGVTGRPQVQQPATLWVPPRIGSYGDMVVDFAHSIGIPTDPTQERDIDILTSYGPGGNWLTLETAIIEGRQNGKTSSVVLPIALWDLFVFNTFPDRMFWTAHRMKTTRDTFEAVLRMIDTYPALSRRVAKIEEGKGDEAVILDDGSRMDFLARTGGAGRGLGSKRVIYDEAMFLQEAELGATIPTMSARPNPQIMYASSAEKATGAHQRGLRARARRGNDPSLTLIEYAAPGGWDVPGCMNGLQCSHLVGEQGCSLDNEDYWMMANHAVPTGRMHLKFIRSERLTLGQTPAGVLEFGRERLGWPELSGVTLDPDRVPLSLWNETVDPLSEIRPDDPVAFAIDMPPDRSAVSVSVAGMRADGKIHFGLIKYERGTAWLRPYLLGLLQRHETVCPILWQPSGPIGALKTELDGTGGNPPLPGGLTEVTGQAMAQACGSWKERVINGTVKRRASAILDTSFTHAERRVNAEGSWTLGRVKSGGDISPVISVVEAIHGIDVYGGSEPSVYVF